MGAIVNPQTLGYQVTADVYLEVEPGMVMTVAKQIAGYDNVTYVACSTGDRDISAQIVAHDNTELYQFVTETLGKTSGVRKTTTSIVPVILKTVYSWRIPQADLIREPGER